MGRIGLGRTTIVGGWIGAGVGGWITIGGGVIGLGVGGWTRIGGGWIRTSGFDLTKNLPPGTLITWKPRLWTFSGMLFLLIQVLTGPLPVGAEKRGC